MGCIHTRGSSFFIFGISSIRMNECITNNNSCRYYLHRMSSSNPQPSATLGYWSLLIYMTQHQTSAILILNSDTLKIGVRKSTKTTPR